MRFETSNRREEQILFFDGWSNWSDVSTPTPSMVGLDIWSLFETSDWLGGVSKRLFFCNRPPCRVCPTLSQSLVGSRNRLATLTHSAFELGMKTKWRSSSCIAAPPFSVAENPVLTGIPHLPLGVPPPDNLQSSLPVVPTPRESKVQMKLLTPKFEPETPAASSGCVPNIVFSSRHFDESCETCFKYRISRPAAQRHQNRQPRHHHLLPRALLQRRRSPGRARRRSKRRRRSRRRLRTL